MSSGTSRGGNLASLDVLRGVAIISVLIGHAWPTALSAPKSLTLFFGQFGVILFFFLSGFLMDRTYAEHRSFFLSLYAGYSASYPCIGYRSF